MANPIEQYCADVMEALRADYPEFDWEVTPDLGPARMQCKDLLLQVNVPEWRPWHDGCMVRATISATLLVRYHGVSTPDDGEGWWNPHGLVAGISSWLTWRRIGQSWELSTDVRVGPSYQRGPQGDGMWVGWLISWEDVIRLPARFEYHFPDRAAFVGWEEPDGRSDRIEGVQYNDDQPILEAELRARGLIE